MISKVVYNDEDDGWNFLLQRLDTVGFRPERFVVSNDSLTEVKVLDGPSAVLLRTSKHSGVMSVGGHEDAGNERTPKSVSSCFDIFQKELSLKRRRLG